MLTTEEIEQFASSLKAHGLIYVVMLGEMMEKTMHEITLLEDEPSRNLLPCRGVVIGIEQAR